MSVYDAVNFGYITRRYSFVKILLHGKFVLMCDSVSQKFFLVLTFYEIIIFQSDWKKDHFSGQKHISVSWAPE